MELQYHKHNEDDVKPLRNEGSVEVLCCLCNESGIEPPYELAKRVKKMFLSMA